MKNIIITALIIVVILSAGFFSFKYLYVPKTVLKFEETSKKLEGPLRGFYIQIDSSEVERLEQIKEDGFSIILVAYDIKDFLNQPISEDKLKELDLLLETVRFFELEVIFRAAYGFDSNYDDPDDIEQIEEHILQIAKVINKYNDVILCVQAGFIGPWGEWHNSDFFTGDERETKFRNQLIEIMIDAYNNSIKINLRRPKFIIEAVKAGLDINRLGFHNDGFLASDTDLGTYSMSRSDALQWARNNISHGINGGEMPMLSDWTDIEIAVKEFRAIGITYLNRMYNKEIFDSWKALTYKGQNAFTYIENHLGYRYALSKVEVSSEIKSNRMFSCNIMIENVGFAPINDTYGLFLIAMQGDEVVLHKLLANNISKLLGGQKEEYNFKFLFDNVKWIESEIPIRFGVYIIDNQFGYNYEGVDLVYLPEQFGTVEFGNTNSIFERGINFIFEYIKVNGIYTLKQ